MKPMEDARPPFKIMKILVLGLPGAGKTTLAKELQKRLNSSILINGDEVRASISTDLGFSHQDRIRQAERIGFMADMIVRSGGTAIYDFVCPTDETRVAFSLRNPADYTIWVSRGVTKCRYADTNQMWTAPKHVNVCVEDAELPASVVAEKIVNHLWLS